MRDIKKSKHKGSPVKNFSQIGATSAARRYRVKWFQNYFASWVPLNSLTHQINFGCRHKFSSSRTRISNPKSHSDPHPGETFNVDPEGGSRTTYFVKI
jgi:hypothetical protein